MTLDRLAVTAHQDVLLGEGEGAMTTDLHQRLVEDLASKGLLDHPGADPAETPLRTVRPSGYPDQVR
jgi:hypothetical protein